MSIIATTTVDTYAVKQVVKAADKIARRQQWELSGSAVPAYIDRMTAKQAGELGLDISQAPAVLFLDLDQEGVIGQGYVLQDKTTGDWWKVVGRPVKYAAGGPTNHIEAPLEWLSFDPTA